MQHHHGSGFWFRALALGACLLWLGPLLALADPPRWGEASAALSTAEQFEIGLAHVESAQPRRARPYFEAAAEGGELRAMLQLGWLHEEGLLGAVDGPAAVHWYRRAVDAGESWYAIKLAWIHLQGRLLPADLEQAESWFEYAIDAGHEEARLGLGSVLLAEVMGGDLGRIDEVLEHFRLALDGGWALASYYLGRIYQEGLGQPVDRGLARDYFQIGAEAGIADVQWRLGQMYAAGEGGERDLLLAAKWGYLALANGAAMGRDVLAQVEPQLSPEQRDEARRLAWQAAGGGDEDAAAP